jgi:AbiU2
MMSIWKEHPQCKETQTMEIDDPRIVALQQKVTAAQEEFDMAVTFHEIWKPAAYDQELHSRLGKSFATQAFLVTRTALRREMVLALVRLWDTNPQAIKMQSIWHDLRDKKIVDALALDRARCVGFLDVLEHMREDLGKRADEVVALIGKYMDGGSSDHVLKTLRNLRNERLAHRQLSPATAPGATATDEEIEEFYQDNSKLISILLSLVNAMAYDPEDTAKVFRHYATCFWAGFQKNEKTKTAEE